MSWWIATSRSQFSEEIAKRFALNKPETALRGYRWEEKSTADRSARGGKAAVRLGSHQKTEE